MNSLSLIRSAGTASDFLDRRFWLCAALFLANVLLCGLVADVRKKLWHDELATLQIAQQPGPAESVKASMEGCDNAPPLYSLTVQRILPLVRNDALAVRLPATLGYCGMILCLLLLCRRRFTAVYAWVATLMAANAAFWTLTEGRPYSMVLFSGAAALLCWQEAAAGVRRSLSLTLMAVSLCLMTAMHYYAVYFLIPLVAAEAVRWWKNGRLDFAMIAAMAPVSLVLAIHYPLIAAGRRLLAHHWSPVSWNDIPDVYSSIFFSFILLPMAVIAISALWRAPEKSSRVQKVLTAPEWTAYGMLLLMPLCVVILSEFTTHVFVNRYTLWASIGISVLITALLYKAAIYKDTVGAITLGLFLGLFLLHEVHEFRRRPDLRLAQSTLDQIERLPKSSEPIVIFNHAIFLELCYHAPQLRERLIYPLSAERDLRYSNNDSGAMMLEALRRRTNLHIVPYDDLLAANKHFILAAGAESYMPWQLIRGGYRVMPLEDTKAPSLYQVDAPAQ
jgi:hypothetical protein